MQEENKEELFKKLDEIRRDVTSLKTELNQIDDKKEEWFKKKEDCSKKIKDSIGHIKDDREKRNSLTKEVKDNKEKREQLNKEVKEKISEAKELNKEKEKISKKHHIHEDPSKIKEQIERLEFKIETEGLSFEKEKGIMSIIKNLKKKYKESEKISNVWDQLHTKSKDIDLKKREAEEMHKKIQKTAKESQDKHEGMIALSKEIDGLKKEEEEAFKRFIEFKTKFNEVNDKLKERLVELNNIKLEVDKHIKSKRLEKESKEQAILRNKEHSVEEKLKKREKLTTEDLLIFQKFEKR